MTVCCYEFFGRRRPAPFCQQTNLVKFSSPKLKLVLQLPAKNFKEIVKIKFDNHKILDNFCLIKNYSEECPRHHKAYSITTLLKALNSLPSKLRHKMIVYEQNFHWITSPFKQSMMILIYIGLIMSFGLASVNSGE